MKHFVAINGGGYPESLEELRDIFETHHSELDEGRVLHIGYSREHWAWIACDEPFTLDEWKNAPLEEWEATLLEGENNG